MHCRIKLNLLESLLSQMMFCQCLNYLIKFIHSVILNFAVSLMVFQLNFK